MKLFKKIITGCVFASVALASCTPFDELNTDPTRMSEANPSSFMNPSLYGMAAYNWDRYNSYTFQLMQICVSTNNVTGLGWYRLTDTAGDGTWSTYYQWLNNIMEIYKNSIELQDDNYRAVSLIMRSWIGQLLVDTYGDCPFSEACLADRDILKPKFDTQEEIYHAIIDSLATANDIINVAGTLKYNSTPEMLYGANSSDKTGLNKWKKFANSLRMRALLRVLDVDGFNARAELQKMISDPETYPVFENNDEAAMLSISGVAPEEAPMTRPADFTSYKVLSSFFIDNLKAWNDPRLPIFASKVTNIDPVTQVEISDYVGIESGYVNLPGGSYSQARQAICIAPMDLAIMPYSEVAFIKAELAQRQIITSVSAEEEYEKAVTAAIEQWGGVVPATYFDNEQTKYDGTLDRIMLQKFYALFFVDYQQWYEHNRTGMPEIPRGRGVDPADTMPKRFKYPASIQRTNMANYQAAKENMGGDDFSLKLMWQK